MPLSPKKGGDKGKLRGRKGKDQADGNQQEYVPPPPPLPGDEFAMPTREVVRPDNQLNLSEAALNEEIAKMLTANNPEAPKNIARFNMKERTYKFEPMVEQTIVHYATDGWLLHKGSEEAKKQTDLEKMENEASQRFQAEVDKAQHDKAKGGGDDDDAPDDSKQLRNQFNFSERAAQTLNYPLRDRGTFTEPPPTATVSGTCNQWQIYDDYVKDLERQKMEDTMKAKGGKKPAGAAAPAAGAAPSAGGGGEGGEGGKPDGDGDPFKSRAMGDAGQILDRMANQNMYEEVASDYKYWEDASDAFRPGEGSLLPLWKFTNDKAKRRQVTAICWNPQYQDLFAAGYGSYEFLKQSSGLICIYSLKNPSHPEFSFTTESGVMCLHFHPEFSNLLAVGCYDGSVLVYDVNTKTDKPIYSATVKTGKHNDPVWSIFWQPDEALKALQFVSISSDGNVNLWTMNKSELTHEDLMKLKVVRPGKQPGEEGGGEEGGIAGGCCLDFCKMPGQEHIYLVGTEEGAIHKCSKAYSSQYLSSFLGHQLSVYAVKWNHLHPRTFLSASADWSVKLWDTDSPKKPVMSFDLNDTVGDVAWAPYSATVFAAVTDDGKVHVFDLFENKLLPMCSQKVVKKAKLTKVVFNPKQPMILVGDDKGVVTSLKLSPNLRSMSSKPTEEELNSRDKVPVRAEVEVAHLDQVLEVARKCEVHEGEGDA